MAGGRNSSTYSRFACCGAGNEAAAIRSSSTCHTNRCGFTSSSRYTRGAAQGTSPASSSCIHYDHGSYSGFARYDAKVTTRTTTPNYACR